MSDTLFGTISLGALINTLERFKRDAEVCFDFHNFAPGPLDSYRGYYDHLAIKPVDPPLGSEPTVGDLLDNCRAAIGQTFQGWKGGYYTMDRGTPVWVAAPGRCPGTTIVDIKPRYGDVVLLTSCDDLEDYR